MLNQERNLFIDFLKGFCIICVILTHNLPESVMKASAFIAWGGMAVPLFLLIQCYHVFNNDKVRRINGIPSKTLKEHYNLKKLWKRIAKPFIIVTLITGLVLILYTNNPEEIFQQGIRSGGFGPGSYYFWIYLQFFLLLPVCLTFINKMGGGILTLLLFILISQALEWISMYFEIPDHLYRLLCFRYILIIYLGYIAVSNKISRTLTKPQIIEALISLTILLFIYYTSISLKPFLYDSWRCFHWICYFYAALLLPWILWQIYDRLPEHIRNVLEGIGRYSYEIFLLQMIVFRFYPHGKIATGNLVIDTLVFIVVSTLLSILPILLLKRSQIYLRIGKKISDEH